MKGKVVYVVGELNPDIIMTGKDLVPEFNREKLLDSFQMVLGSSSAITASNLAGLGGDVRFVSVIGDDSLGRFCLDELNKAGIGTQHVRVDPRWSTGVTLSFSTASDRALMTHLGAISRLRPEFLPEEMYEEASHIHFGSYFLLDDMRPHWNSVFERAAGSGITTSFDAGWDINGNWNRDAITELLKVTDWFIPNEEELLQIFDAETIGEAIRKLPNERGGVVVKRGSKGALCIDRDGKTIEAKPFPVVPVDTTGAGDSFNAGMIYEWVSGQGITEALRVGCACGALATLRIGGAGNVPSREEVGQFISGFN
ncbi:carbohydrate kinase family protein [Cohnella herbarum]|uniref:Carbohydrate kinase family protein n=1 Tax=Cohnella herbarum TaxID=2728023 RepID=A0A7Z2VQZ7_9BACL|nr:carbohydrate kinase family protein [Cohnella herbarum]QJD87535.1 carbohydrate kinase family protein [Cohnella herbarum]